MGQVVRGACERRKNVVNSGRGREGGAYGGCQGQRGRGM